MSFICHESWQDVQVKLEQNSVHGDNANNFDLYCDSMAASLFLWASSGVLRSLQVILLWAVF
jgi:hypothetical protein